MSPNFILAPGSTTSFVNRFDIDMTSRWFPRPDTAHIQQDDPSALMALFGVSSARAVILQTHGPQAFFCTVAAPLASVRTGPDLDRSLAVGGQDTRRVFPHGV